ncbi:MAG: porin [Rhodospirillaceae bacterium]|nr:porin [Rhodospirillaceae bacterium]
MLAVTANAGARADDASSTAAAPPANPLGASFTDASASAGGAFLTMGTLSPTFGSVTLGLSPSAPTNAVWIGGQDVSGGFVTSLYGSQLGVFGGYTDRPTLFAQGLATAWNLGASVGYGGFYLRGGFSDVAERGLVDAWQTWQAGFGYGTGSLDLRVTYVSSDAVTPTARNIGGLDTNQWMIGGIYQISPGIRVNADAFYGTRELATPYGRLSATPGATAPQGAGARVGVQLRF